MKFVHMSDVHLGLVPDKGMPWSEERARERFRALERVIDLCNREQVDLLLSVGDLFDQQPSVAEIREVKYQFSRLERTKVVLLAGNHDYLSARSRYPELVVEDRVFLLPGGEVGALTLPSLNVTVYGVSYDGRSIQDNLLQGLRPQETKGYHILMAHGGDAGYLPFDKQELAQAGFDYVAMGHIHKTEWFGERMSYVGSLEPFDKAEIGPHGVILAELQGTECRTEFLPLASREYRMLPMTVTPEMGLRELADRITREILPLGDQHIYRVILEGYHDPEAPYDVVHLVELLNESVRVLEVMDQSLPYYDFDQLQAENGENLLGQFLERARELPGESAWKEKVMAAGVSALLTGRDEQ